MAWTYDFTAFADTAVGTYTGSTKGERYQIRFWLQDTNTNRQLFQDEEIDWAQTQEANRYMAAASLCDVLIAKAGGLKMKKISEFQIAYDPRYYQILAGQLRARGAGHQVPYAGGISISDKLAQQSDTNWVPPAVPRGLDNNPAAPAPATPSTNPLTSI